MSVFEEVSARSYSVREVAEFDGVSEQTIRRRVSNGQYPNSWRTPSDSKFGGTIMIPEQDILDLRRRGKIYG